MNIVVQNLNQVRCPYGGSISTGFLDFVLIWIGLFCSMQFVVIIFRQLWPKILEFPMPNLPLLHKIA